MERHQQPITNEDFKIAQSNRHTSMTHEYPESPWFDEVFGEFWQYIRTPHLDIGARNGTLVERLKIYGIEAVGLEITDIADFAFSMGRNVVKGDIQQMTQFQPGQFSSATMLHTLEHCYNPDSAVDEIKRILNGHLMVIVPAQPAEKGIDYKYAHFTRFDSCYDVANLLWLHDFEIIKAYEKGWAVHVVIAKTK